MSFLQNRPSSASKADAADEDHLHLSPETATPHKSTSSRRTNRWKRDSNVQGLVPLAILCVLGGGYYAWRQWRKGKKARPSTMQPKSVGERTCTRCTQLPCRHRAFCQRCISCRRARSGKLPSSRARGTAARSALTRSLRQTKRQRAGRQIVGASRSVILRYLSIHVQILTLLTPILPIRL